MDDNDFEKLCKSLEQAIAHASGEVVEGVVIHAPKTESNINEQKSVPLPKQVSSRLKSTEQLAR